jgi:hypothetical protein
MAFKQDFTFYTLKEVLYKPVGPLDAWSFTREAAVFCSLLLIVKCVVHLPLHRRRDEI